MEQVFAYGTLRPSGPNHDLLQDSLLYLQDAVAPGLALHAPAHHGFPYAVPAAGSSVRGTLCHITDGRWPALCVRLDRLEGYRPDQPLTSHYLRRRWPVVTADGAQHMAWVYLAGPAIPVDRMPRITSGDWFRRLRSGDARAGGRA